MYIHVCVGIKCSICDVCTSIFIITGSVHIMNPILLPVVSILSYSRLPLVHGAGDSCEV